MTAQVFYSIHTLAEFTQVVIVCVSIAGGEKGLGSGVEGFLAVIALLVQVDLTQALKGVDYDGLTEEKLFKIVIDDVAHLSHWILLFGFSYIVHEGKDFWNGVQNSS